MARGKHTERPPAGPGSKHSEGFDKAMREALKQLPDSGERTYRVELSMKVEQRPNPGWVIDYIVDLT